MTFLPVANILHHKLRSVLSAFGIAVGICMLVVLSGLSRGSLSEVADRWESVDADLIAVPRGYDEADNDNLITLSGLGVPDSYAAYLLREHGDLVRRACPVFLYKLNLGGQGHMSSGIDAGDWDVVAGGKKLVAGRLPDADGRFARWFDENLKQSKRTGPDDEDEEDIPPERQLVDIAANGGFEMVIDQRLARVTKLRVGDDVTIGQHTWRVVGIAPEGVVSRIFVPRRTAQHVFGHSTLRSTIQFIQLQPGVDPQAARTELTNDYAGLILVTDYRRKLEKQFEVMFKYVSVVNVISLAIAFLFIMNTLYTMVLQRTREIAILRSCGASGAFIVRQVLAESLLLTLLGVAIGLAITWPAKWGIEHAAPLLTVTIGWPYIAAGVGAAVLGAMISAFYPAYRATRVDMVEALTLE
ncbi:MAG: ABC transporter permease [Phycisphaerae bacterium]|nr:ABC transporter permease [Phycisphaerae bacterium]